MLFQRSTRALPFASAAVAVVSSALGLVMGAKKGLPLHVIGLETEGFLLQALAALALLAFAAGLASFTRIVEATGETRSEARPYSSLILGLGALAASIHIAGAVFLVVDDSHGKSYRTLASGESLALGAMVITASAVFRAVRRPGAMLVSVPVAAVMLARGTLVVVRGGLDSGYIADPAGGLWIVSSLAFGLWLIVASISTRELDPSPDALVPSGERLPS